MRKIVFSALTLLLLAACTKEEEAMMQKEAEKVMDQGSSTAVMEKDDSDAMPKKEGGAMMRGTYAAYHDGVIGNGQTSVLFFHAAWCPVCKSADTKLRAWFADPANAFLPVYKVDYDAAAELKRRYGVTYQHTFIKIDGQGNMLSREEGPSDSELRALLRK